MVLIMLVFAVLCLFLRACLNTYNKNELAKKQQKLEKQWLDLAKAQGPQARAPWAPPFPKQRVG